ncbi:hypothetical protein QAD02_020799 [Eretmocerus hayati]|uniref:Uncharacterized protein n=1 Tax=Eretmocerus hayati TaxID=131215 RepID=A0ACC2PPQ6_9HYME|nr:hypothetical protein QAD02_020799 [Eretmocerus hayati]
MILNYNGEFEVSAEGIEDKEGNKHVSICDKQLIKDHQECKQLFCVNVLYKAKAVLAKCSKLPVAARNHPGFSKAVLDLQALAFLPPDKIQAEFDRQCAVMEPQLRAHMSPILDEYFSNYWLKVITPRGFSVYGLDTRTNDGSESNNHTMHTDLGKRPQTCIAMYRLSLMFVRIRRVIEQSRNLEQIRWLPSYRTMLVEKKLFKAWRELERPPVNLPVPEFIIAIGRLKGKRGGDVNKGIARIAEEYVDAEFARLERTPTDLINPGGGMAINQENDSKPDLPSKSGGSDAGEFQKLAYEEERTRNLYPVFSRKY